MSWAALQTAQHGKKLRPSTQQPGRNWFLTTLEADPPLLERPLNCRLWETLRLRTQFHHIQIPWKLRSPVLVFLCHWLVWMKKAACCISKQRMLWPSSHQSLPAVPQWAQGLTQDAKPSPTAVTLNSAPWKEQTTSPGELRCSSKGWFQWAQTLASSHI